LKVEEELNLFAVFPINATIQDGSKRKEAMKKNLLSLFYIAILYSNIFKKY